MTERLVALKINMLDSGDFGHICESCGAPRSIVRIDSEELKNSSVFLCPTCFEALTTSMGIPHPHPVQTGAS
jgi:hypothetical protein